MSNQLRESVMSSDPLIQFKRWYETAVEKSVPLPNAGSLATVTAANRPANRMVISQLVAGEGFLFYSNYESDKGRDLARNPYGALLFWWGGLNWQIRVEGEIGRYDEQLADQYFAQRPREAQLGVRISPQSKPIVKRAVLEDLLEQEREIWLGQEISRPAHWGGYLLRPNKVEFWQQGDNRLHDRFLYHLSGGSWSITRLAP